LLRCFAQLSPICTSLRLGSARVATVYRLSVSSSPVLSDESRTQAAPQDHRWLLTSHVV
ncbi:hypothetical protein U1Q18_006721, partial [Sarracenia purpurea var. burkii]